MLWASGCLFIFALIIGAILAGFLGMLLADAAKWAFVSLLGVVAGGVLLTPLLVARSIWRDELLAARKRAVKDLASTLDDDQPLHWVDVQYTDGEAVGGRDSGVLWVEGDRMHFVGRYSDFSLTPFELHRWSKTPSLEIFGKGAVAMHLREGGLIGHRKIVMNAMDSQRSAELAGEMRRFEELPITEVRGQLPPIGLGPEAGPIRVGWQKLLDFRGPPLKFNKIPIRSQVGELLKVGAALMVVVGIWSIYRFASTLFIWSLIGLVPMLLQRNPIALEWIASLGQFDQLKKEDRARLERAGRDALRESPYSEIRRVDRG